MKTDDLGAWLTDPRATEYFGRTFDIRAAVLAQAITGEGSLAGIARRKKVSRQAVHKQAVRARAIFLSSPGS